MTFEIIGMVLLMIAFVPQFGAEGIWISAFTAISAFCNAGFDLFGRFGQYSSLAPYVSNYYVQAVIMFLIMAESGARSGTCLSMPGWCCSSPASCGWVVPSSSA